MTRRARVLLAASQAAEVDALVAGLDPATYATRTCTAERAPTEVESFRPDLVVTDVDAREPSALRRLMRELHVSYRPLVLSIVDRGMTTTETLGAGADACLHRPFDAVDVAVHVSALLRRAPWLTHAIIEVGALVIDESAHIALYDGEQLELTSKEFAILCALAIDAGTVVSKRSLLERLWGFDGYDENLVEVHVSALRRRLPPGASRMVQTIRGAGYVLRTSAPQERPA